MKAKVLAYLICLLSYLLVSYSIVFFFDDHTIISLSREDGMFETLSALYFLSASVLFFILFLKDTSGNEFHFFRTNKNIFFLLLAIVFFFGFGEEISWGQRIFNVKTPEPLEELNIQHEINIHNLSLFHRLDADGNKKSFFALMLNIDRLFSIFWFTYFLIVPIVSMMNTSASRVLKTINVPIGTLWLGTFFMINYLSAEIMESCLADNLIQPLTEIKECNFAFLFVMASIWFLKNYNYHTENLTS